MMENNLNLPLPVRKALRKLGHDLNEARRRRRITMTLMAERAGMTRITLSKIEKGDASVSLGGYASVLFVLGLVDRLKDVADLSHDMTGREMADEILPQRIRMSSGKIKKKNEDEQ